MDAITLIAEKRITEAQEEGAFVRSITLYRCRYCQRLTCGTSSVAMAWRNSSGDAVAAPT